MKKKFRVALFLLLVLSSVSLLAACNAQDDVECYECGKVFELNYADYEDDEGNSHERPAYICKDCAYEQGFIDGYNYLVDKIADGDYSNLQPIDEIPITDDGEIDFEKAKEDRRRSNKEEIEEWNRTNPDNQLDEHGNPIQ